MKIDFVRSGGFAGLRLATSVDTDSLDVKEASKLEALVEEAGFFDLPEKSAIDTTGRDRFQYRVTIAAARTTHTIAVDDSHVPERLRPLLDYLGATALRRKDAPGRATNQSRPH